MRHEANKCATQIVIFLLQKRLQTCFVWWVTQSDYIVPDEQFEQKITAQLNFSHLSHLFSIETCCLAVWLSLMYFAFYKSGNV
ncbi:hypothetical protein NQ315_011096 [Exocentrus adspersus]|uniref:Uncharacterized protein n=1 Tax=Exocentrus adspersus TaxID=1586481 RepID=A0AAV8VWP8_9CUCU|nr:hypothetical protein NQ315_011096 [Exocentrus adspersus]